MADIFEIAGRIHSTSQEHVTSPADEILDTSQNKKQHLINADVARHESEINSPTNGLNKRVEDIEALGQIGDTPVETNASNIINNTSLNGKVPSASAVNGVYNAVVANSGYYTCDSEASTAAKVVDASGYVLTIGGCIKLKMTNANTVNEATLNINSTGAKALYYQGERASATNSWDAEEVVEIYYDGTSYYANNVKGGSGSGVYDVSKEHPTSGPNSDGKFTLEYILNPSNVNELIPVNKRYPGMSIQFVSTYNNKYAQYRLMSDTFNTTPSNWQGIDDEPTVGSDNLVKSGGVEDRVIENQIKNGFIQTDYIANTTIINLKAKKDDVAIVSYTGTNSAGIGFYKSDDTRFKELQNTQNALKFVLTDDLEYIKVLYGSISNVDIRIIPHSDNALLTSGTYYNGGLVRLEEHDCNINAGSTVYVHLEGSGCGIRLKGEHNTDITIPSEQTSYNTTVIVEENKNKLLAIYGNVLKCIISTKEQNVQEIKDYVDWQEKGVTAEISEANIAQSTETAFFAEPGDTVSLSFNGVAGTGVQLRNGTNIIRELTIPSGSTSINTNVVLYESIDRVRTIYGALTDVHITKTAYNQYEADIDLSNKIDLYAAIKNGGTKQLSLSNDSFERGSINAQGQDYDDSRAIRIKNYIRIIPSSTVTVSVNQNFQIRLVYFDENFDFISRSESVDGTSSTLTIPDNAYYSRFYVTGTYDNFKYSVTGASVVVNSFPQNIPAASIDDIKNLREDVNESKAYIKYEEEGKAASVIADTLVGSVRHPFFAKAGDVISYQFAGAAGVYLQFRDKDDKVVYTITTTSGGTQVSGTFVLNSDCKTVNAAFGNLTAVEITKSEAYSAFHESRSNIDYSSILPSGSSKTIELLYLDFESGSINISGINYDSASALRLKNYKRVIPNSTISLSIVQGYSIRAYYWDNDLNYIGRSDSISGTTDTVTIPENASYVKFVITKTSGTLSILGFNSTNTVVTLQNAPKNVPAAPYTVEKQIEELQTYKEQSVIRLTQEDACEGFAITSTPEEFNSVNFALISGIYCHGVKTIKIPLMPNSVGLACIFYDEHGDTVVKRESQTGEEYATKIVEVPENAYAVSFNIRSYKFLKEQHDADPTFDIQSHLLNMELQFPKGVIGENGKRPAVLVDSNGNYPRHYFSPRVCQKPNDFYSEVIDDNDYVENSECTTGVFVLPPNYTPNGKPCPVIMYSHGSSTHIRYKQWGTNANLHNLITYWASLGYAVFDCNGARNSDAAIRGAGCPQNVSAFRKTWEYIKRNYNVEDSVYVIGSSGGGLTAINFCRFTSGVKAFAGLENDVYVVDTWTNQGVDHESFFKYYGFNRLPEGTEYTLANYEESKVSGWDLKKSEFTINNTTMILGFPVPTKVWAGGTYPRWTNFVNYLNNGGTPAFLRVMPGLDHMQICTNSIAVANDVVDWFKINS